MLNVCSTAPGLTVKDWGDICWPFLGATTTAQCEICWCYSHKSHAGRQRSREVMMLTESREDISMRKIIEK